MATNINTNQGNEKYIDTINVTMIYEMVVEYKIPRNVDPIIKEVLLSELGIKISEHLIEAVPINFDINHDVDVYQVNSIRDLDSPARIFQNDSVNYSVALILSSFNDNTRMYIIKE